ncbi:MAG TPA: hypothetical protein VGB45_14125 [Abditibacterium sp.]
MNSFVSATLLRQSFLGALLVLVSLPFLWLLHRAFGLGNPPITGIVVLGGAVVVSMAGAGVVGLAIGQARGNALVAALLGLLLGATVSAIAAPLYGSLVVDGLTNDAVGMVWSERDKITGGAQNALTSRAGETFSAARQGKLREQLDNLQREAQEATTAEARSSALQKAKQTALELANLGKSKGVELFKKGVARSSAFALLFWTILAAPLAAAFEAKRARR